MKLTSGSFCVSVLVPVASRLPSSSKALTCAAMTSTSCAASAEVEAAPTSLSWRCESATARPVVSISLPKDKPAFLVASLTSALPARSSVIDCGGAVKIEVAMVVLLLWR